ncbi:MAG: branched-chain amino acid ABC transporter permease [Nitrososphaerota archaeon]|nr:branched-chain amino acid ABC transporter permease [Candidatus Bathyarchaeota archaeon]MDW8024212.1 branched-chain amino acid ABC transporter permease [Nitrososphaerota archaeon]
MELQKLLLEKRVFRDTFIALIITGLLYILHFFLPVSTVIDIGIYAIFVLSFDLIYGYMGWLAIGYPLYLGIGAYSAGMFMKYVNSNPFLSLFASLVFGVIIGIIVGPLVLRRRGAYFALVNAALNWFGYFLVIIPLKDFTGGRDGTWVNIEATSLLNVLNRSDFLIVVLMIIFILAIFYKRLLVSPFGKLLLALKENEDRVKFLGYNDFCIKLCAFTISTALASLAGALFVIHYWYVSPDIMMPTRALEVISATLVGGAGTFYGAFVGSFIFIALKDYLSIYLGSWEMYLGIFIIAIMLILRKGVWGYVEQFIRKYQLAESTRQGQRGEPIV